MNITITIRNGQSKPSRLTGLCNQYKFQREFLTATKAKAKFAEYEITEAGIYHCKDPIETATWRYGKYVRVSDSGEITEITEAEAVAEFSLALA